MRTLDHVVESFTASGKGEELAWLDSFRSRYLALEDSEHDWRGASSR